MAGGAGDFYRQYYGAVAEMLAIGWLCWDASGRGQHDSEKMHLVYEVVEFVGRWSMIDVLSSLYFPRWCGWGG